MISKVEGGLMISKVEGATKKPARYCFGTNKAVFFSLYIYRRQEVQPNIRLLCQRISCDYSEQSPGEFDCFAIVKDNTSRL